MPKQTLDYSLYLVTGRDLLPAGKVNPTNKPAPNQLTVRIITSPSKRWAPSSFMVGATS